jgi:hypothetical protein
MSDKNPETLPEQVQHAIAAIDAEGLPEDKAFVRREIARVLAIAHFKIAQRKVVEQLNPDVVGDGSDAAIEAAIERAFD